MAKTGQNEGKLKPRKIESTKMSAEELKSTTEIEVQGLASVSTSVKKSVVNINSKKELRFLVDQYYQAQNYRITADSQIRSILQDYDTSDNGKIPDALQWVAEDLRNQEKQIKKMLDEYTNSSAIGRWIKANIGIGPVIAAGLIAYFDISKCNHVNQFNMYAGLNNNNVPWLGTEKGKAIVIRALTECGFDPSKVKKSDAMNDDVIAKVASLSGRNVNFIYRNSLDKDSNVVTRGALEKHLALIPYNKNLKVLCYKIGQSFVKVSGKDGSLYGRVYKERKLDEMVRNDNHEFADQARQILATKRFGDNKTKELYEEGKLPPAHIEARAERYATKLFISHLFDAMYIDYYHKEPPVPYPIAYQGHVDIIPPEVPYEDFLDCSNLAPRDN